MNWKGCRKCAVLSTKPFEMDGDFAENIAQMPSEASSS